MDKFNLRVYGLLLNEKREILLSSELRHGKHMIKFPGGGLEFGEGQKECLRREFQEECNIDIEVGELFYVSDFLQVSAFRPNEQLISFYYWVKYDSTESLHTFPFDIEHTKEGEKQVWRPLDELKSEDMTFPIDQAVVGKLLAEI